MIVFWGFPLKSWICTFLQLRSYNYFLEEKKTKTKKRVKLNVGTSWIVNHKTKEKLVFFSFAISSLFFWTRQLSLSQTNEAGSTKTAFKIKVSQLIFRIKVLKFSFNLAVPNKYNGKHLFA